MDPEKEKDAGVKEQDSGAPQNQEEATGSDNSGGAEGEVKTVEALLAEEKAAHEQTATERDNYKQALEQKRQLRKGQGQQGDQHVDAEGEDDDEDDRPATVGDLKRFSAQQTAETNVETILNTMVTDPKKRELVRTLYDNRIAKTGTSAEAVKVDLQAALDLADVRITKRKNEELARMNNQQHGNPPLRGSGGGSDGPTPSKEHGWSEDQVRVLTARAQALGLDTAKYLKDSWNNTKRT